MKNSLNKFKNHPKYDTFVNWGKLISITGSAQIVVQAVGFACGILIIRLLPVEEYAFYTLANTMLGTMTVLADGGISTGVMAEGSKVWQDKDKLGAVLTTGLNLRKKFAIGSLVVSVPILLYLLLHNGASWITSAMIALALIPAFYAALSDSLLEIIPKLHQAIMPLQKNQVTVGLGRLGLTALTMFIFPWAFIGVLAAGIPRAFGNIQLRKICYEFANKDAIEDAGVRSEILNLVKKIMPTSIYYCLSGQITIWLISIFGNTTSLAQLGALSRLGALLSVLSTIIGTLVIPRFAKLKLDKKILYKHFGQIVGLIIFLSVFIILIVFLFPKPILWLLGKSYSSLSTELLLSILNSCMGLLAGTVFGLYSCRGWAMSPYLMIFVNVFSIVSLACLLDLSSLQGVLYFNICLTSVGLIQLSSFLVYKIYSI